MAQDGNTAIEALAGSDEAAKLRAQLEELQTKLSTYEGAGNVVQKDFGGEVPRYRLNTACFLEDDTLHTEGEEIEYWGCPNLEMVPLNETAKQKIQGYIDHLEAGARIAAERNGRTFQGLITDRGVLIAQAQQDARIDAGNTALRPMVPTDKGDVPQMPHMPEAQAKQRRLGKPPRAQLVAGAKPAPAPGQKQSPMPVPILGRTYTADTASRSGGS